MDNRCVSCPEEVEWRRVSFQPLMPIMETVLIEPGGKLVVPMHLQQDNIRQFSVIVDYRKDAKLEEIEHALEESGISWDSMRYPMGRIWGGSVFKLPGRKGYWILKAPCLDCYTRLATTDETRLERCALMAYL